MFNIGDLVTYHVYFYTGVGVIVGIENKLFQGSRFIPLYTIFLPGDNLRYVESFEGPNFSLLEKI